MSIQILNVNELQSALQKMWQQDLVTSEDPANGQWYTSGANGDSIGLYGELTDTAPSQLTFNTAAQVFLPSQITCSTAIMDNRNGINPSGSVTLSYTYTNGSSYTQTTTSSINTTTSVGFQVSASFEGVGASASANFSVNLATP